MCGIAGIVHRRQKHLYSKKIREMLSLIQHRGPDDCGIHEDDSFSFGHVRLSILDTTSAGHQPMLWGDKYVITYNGEIYNYLELRKELSNYGYSFDTQTDTEVILAAYDKWGEQCVYKFNGMFAFGIYDKTKDLLYLARDRIGVKPLYYSTQKDELYFFSEPKQIIISKIIDPKPNMASIREYLAFQFVLGNETFFVDINKLEPGSYAIYKNGNLNIVKYWDIDCIKVDCSLKYPEAVEKVKSLVEASVAYHLRSDVKVGSYLSGGIDSSVVSAIASKLLGTIDTYTFTSKRHPRIDESVDASDTSKFIFSRHHEVELLPEDVFQLWKEAIYFMDEPEVGYSLLSQLIISKEVSKDLKVVLGGQGGDELFFGYGWYNDIILNNFTKRISYINVIDKIRIIFNFIKNSSFKKVFLHNKIGAGIVMNYFNIWSQYGCFDLLKNNKNMTEKFCTKLGYDGSIDSIKKFEFKYWLRGLLHVEDRSSMAHSLESRTPLIDDHNLIEYVFSLPPSFMIDGSTNKKVFKDAFKHQLLPKIYRKKNKQGYPSPITEWLSQEKVMSYAKKTLLNKDSFVFNFINHNIQLETISCRQLWMLVSLELWHTIFILGESIGDVKKNNLFS